MGVRRSSSHRPSFVVISHVNLDAYPRCLIDPFGNYLYQKLVERCSAAECTVIVREVADSLPTIAMNMHGTRSAQRLVEQLTTDEQVTILWWCGMVGRGLRFILASYHEP